MLFPTIINILMETIFYSGINKRCVDAFWSKVVGECGGARYDSVLRWFSSAPSHVRDTFRQTWNHRCDKSCHTYLSINFISTSITYYHFLLYYFFHDSFICGTFLFVFRFNRKISFDIFLRIYPFLITFFITIR